MGSKALPFIRPEHFPLTAKLVYEMLSESTDAGSECLFGYRSRLDLAMVMLQKDALEKKCKDYYAGNGKSMEEWYPSAKVRGWIDKETAGRIKSLIRSDEKDDVLSQSSSWGKPT